MLVWDKEHGLMSRLAVTATSVVLELKCQLSASPVRTVTQAPLSAIALTTLNIAYNALCTH